MALRRKTVEAPEVVRGGSSRGMKSFIVLLFALCFAVVAFYGYLALVRRTQFVNELKKARSGVVRARAIAENVASHADRILNDKLEKVNVLSELVQKISTALGLTDIVKVGKPVENRWRKSNYNEVRVDVQFFKKEGFEFANLMKFLQNVEKANPKVQIKHINFGKRDPPGPNGEKPDVWRPTGMTVRVFTPRGS